MNDRAGLEQDAHRREQHETGADRQLQAADLEEQAGQHRTHQHEETGGDETTEEAHVLAGNQHIGRQATENQGRHRERRADHLGATGHTQVTVEDRAEQEAHEAGEGEGGHQAPDRITQLVGEEEQAVEADQHHENVRVADAHLLRHVGHDATEGEGDSQQPVCVTQDAADLLLLDLLAVIDGVILFAHGDTPVGLKRSDAKIITEPRKAAT
ncbi:hypothetical protein D3C78_1328310 [compost metagenome]